MKLILILLSWIVASTSAQLIPTSFDARTRWPNCPSIALIPNQGCCNSSAFQIPAAVITDRACIRSNGTSTRTYSAYDALACCTDCPFSQLFKCAGGDPLKVWNYWATTGLVSDSCMPFSLSPLCLGFNCPLLCAPGYAGSIVGDRKKGLKVVTVAPYVDAIQSEIILNGPVEASFDLYLDFVHLKQSQVYNSRSGPNLGRQSVKIIGWGVENGTEYWLITSTFGIGWGNQGTAMFLRGVNHLGIESHVHCGTPNVELVH
ncbi:cathepsin B [Culex quinquefasciatus]|uniref:cathepsin B n=1 Tax=Culex quinquefasciatus TaxID=7176 RepID=UPI0018E3D7D7|nr:cathepsin B [Culex quinquefasciatus]